MYCRTSARRQDSALIVDEEETGSTTWEQVHAAGMSAEMMGAITLKKTFDRLSSLFLHPTHLSSKTWSIRLLVRPLSLSKQAHTDPLLPDISLAAFGRKEIEIAEVCLAIAIPDRLPLNSSPE